MPYLNGKFYPLIMGGSGEGDGGAAPAGGTGGASGVSAGASSAAPGAGSSSSLDSSRSFSPETYEAWMDERDGKPELDQRQAPDPETPNAEGEGAEGAADPAAPAWLSPDFLNQVPADQAQPAQQQQADPYTQVYQQASTYVQQLDAAQAQEAQLVQAHMQYMSPQEAQFLWQQHEHQNALREVERQKAQVALDRAQVARDKQALDPVARDTLIERMVRETQKYLPGIDAADMRDTLSQYGDGRHMLIRAQDYVRAARKSGLAQRARKGTDFVGGNGVSTENSALSETNVTKLLSQGYKAMAQSGRSRRFRSY